MQSKMFVLQYAVFLSSNWLYSGPYMVTVFRQGVKQEYYDVDVHGVLGDTWLVRSLGKTQHWKHDSAKS